MIANGDVAIVTGAGQGMGREFAYRLCREGATVAIAESNAASGQETTEALIDAGYSAVFYEVDVRDSTSVGAMVTDLVGRFGHLDILVNNAGVVSAGPSEDVQASEWGRVLDIMLTGLFQCSQIAARTMIPQRSGSIINIASIAGMDGWAERVSYNAAKAGVIALTRTLGVEWAQHNVRVNAIAPGQVETPLNEHVFASGLADREVFTNRTPMRRFADPSEIAEAVLFLAGSESSYVTAEVLIIDGGWMAWSQLQIDDSVLLE